MTDIAAMVKETGTAATPELVGAIEALVDCAQVSSACAGAMVRTGGMADEVRLALDCADVCTAAARVLSRGAGHPTVIGATVEAAAVACEAGAVACGKHGDHHVHCRLHASSARACGQALRTLQARTSSRRA
ncbi:hypothetical protein ACL02T_24740 [Pseudonocardia sp. RS010]|uniref:hypothetical protein n=1 Tax=Pseudonocardia sp. RS010 TaxID=3385979 RepID=UPI0039A3D8A2